MHLHITMGQPLAPTTRIMTIMRATVRLPLQIPQDLTGTTPAGIRTSWAKRLSGVSSVLYFSIM